MKGYKIIKICLGGGFLFAPMIAIPFISTACATTGNQYKIALKYEDEYGEWKIFTSYSIDVFANSIGSLKLSYSCTNPNVHSQDVNMNFLTNPPEGFALNQDSTEKNVWALSWNISNKTDLSNLESFKIGATANNSSTIPGIIKFTGFDSVNVLGFNDAGYHPYITIDKSKDISIYQQNWTTLDGVPSQTAKLGYAVKQKNPPSADVGWTDCVLYSSGMSYINGFAVTNNASFSNWTDKFIAVGILPNPNKDAYGLSFKISPNVESWDIFDEWYSTYTIESQLINWYGYINFNYYVANASALYEVDQQIAPGADLAYVTHQIWVEMNYS